MGCERRLGRRLGQGLQAPRHAGRAWSLWPRSRVAAGGGGQRPRHAGGAERGRPPPNPPARPQSLTGPPREFQVANESAEGSLLAGCKRLGRAPGQGFKVAEARLGFVC